MIGTGMVRRMLGVGLAAALAGPALVARADSTGAMGAAHKAGSAASQAATDTGNAAKSAGNAVSGAADNAGKSASGAAEHAGASADDATITTKVKSTLAREGSEARGIHVDTSAGVVTLSGTVTSEATRDTAVKAAEKTSGVTRVDDQITVKSGKK
jgi:hyperosmotically inducible protein